RRWRSVCAPGPMAFSIEQTKGDRIMSLTLGTSWRKGQAWPEIVGTISKREGTMPGNRRSSWVSPLLRGGAVLGVLLAGVGVACLWQSSSQAEAAISARNAGVFKDKDKLLITVGIANRDAKEVSGTLAVELLDARGRIVGRANRQV